jgi:hypothetical protein
LPSELSNFAVPISKIQCSILHLLASQRDEESYVAGSTLLNRDTPRFSHDIDVFHDRHERVADVATADTELLRQHGFEIRWIRQQPAIYSAVVQLASDSTKLEWVADISSAMLARSLTRTTQ